MAAAALEPHFRRLRGKLTRALGVQLFLVGLVGLAAHRTGHWAAWIAFAVVALFLGAGMTVNVLRGRMLRRFQGRLAARPESLVWAHVETENKKQTLLELWTDDGDSCVIPIPAATFTIAKKLAEDAGAVAVSRTRDERAARIVIFENDVKLKRLQARLASPESPLAHALRPTLEAWIATWRTARAGCARTDRERGLDLPRRARDPLHGCEGSRGPREHRKVSRDQTLHRREGRHSLRARSERDRHAPPANRPSVVRVS